MIIDNTNVMTDSYSGMVYRITIKLFVKNERLRTYIAKRTGTGRELLCRMKFTSINRIIIKQFHENIVRTHV